MHTPLNPTFIIKQNLGLQASRKHLHTDVNTLHIVNTGGIWDWYIKTINHGNFSIKSYVLAISCGGDSNRSPHVISWRTSGIYAKSSLNSGLLDKNFMDTEVFT